MPDEERPVAGEPQHEKPMRVRTMAELAQLAGVTAGTVSRALADSPLVSARTRERIKALAHKHDFRLNEMARRLRTQRSGVIGIVIPLGHERRQHISDPFFMTMFGHLADRLTESGHDLMLSRVIPDAPDWLDRIVDSGMLDGVLMIGQSDQFATIERVAQRYRPMVVWGVHKEGQRHCSVGTDNVRGGYLAAQHLIERGARRLAFLGDIAAPEVEARYRGCIAAAADAGVATEVELLRTHFAQEDMERDLAAHFAERLDRINGLIAASDVIAMMALRSLADRGIKVPSQVKLVGYDDIPLASQTVPRLSTIKQDVAAGAAAMVDLLFRRMAEEDAPSVVLEPSLVMRNSS